MPHFKLMISFGTRPELIKLAPLIQLAQHQTICHVHCTGQHIELLRAPMSWFHITPDTWTDATQHGGLTTSLASMLEPCHRAVIGAEPDAVVVHGDTTSALAMSLAAFYLRVPVIHLEAGLRTGDPDHPWPEERHRQMLTVLSAYHLSPTTQATNALITEGIKPECIEQVGNTVIDALLWSRERLSKMSPAQLEQHGVPKAFCESNHTRPMVLITAHRREHFEQPTHPIVDAVAELAHRYPDINWVWSVHPNPKVKRVVYAALSSLENVLLLDPLPYPAFVYMMQCAQFIMTDSGGIQEEATVLGTPVIVLRHCTERTELLDVGQGQLTGLTRSGIIEAVEDGLEHKRVFDFPTLYGRGDAASKSLHAIERWLGAV